MTSTQGQPTCEKLYHVDLMVVQQGIEPWSNPYKGFVATTLNYKTTKYQYLLVCLLKKETVRCWA